MPLSGHDGSPPQRYTECVKDAEAAEAPLDDTDGNALKEAGK